MRPLPPHYVRHLPLRGRNTQREIERDPLSESCGAGACSSPSGRGDPQRSGGSERVSRGTFPRGEGRLTRLRKDPGS